MKVNIAETAVEENLAGVQFELQAELLIVDVVVATEVQKSVVEIGQGFLEIAHQEIGYTLLEVGNGKILVQTHSALVAIDLGSSVKVHL